jgi:hypothetical protein
VVPPPPATSPCPEKTPVQPPSYPATTLHSCPGPNCPAPPPAYPTAPSGQNQTCNGADCTPGYTAGSSGKFVSSLVLSAATLAGLLFVL